MKNEMKEFKSIFTSVSQCSKSSFVFRVQGVVAGGHEGHGPSNFFGIVGFFNASSENFRTLAVIKTKVSNFAYSKGTTTLLYMRLILEERYCISKLFLKS